MCLFVVFLVVGAAKAEQWEYVQFTTMRTVVNRIGPPVFMLLYPDGKTDVWENRKPPKNFKDFSGRRVAFPFGGGAGGWTRPRKDLANSLICRNANARLCCNPPILKPHRNIAR
jgi:hypothetical protein